MGLKIIIEFKVGNSAGYKKKKPIIPFEALAKGTGDAYFGGEMKLDSDKIGLFIEPILKFSGLELTFEGQVTVGWFKRSIEVKDILVPEKIIHLKKNYLT